MKFYDFNSYRVFYANKKMLLVMKLTAILLLAFVLQVSATGYAQKKVTINEKNATLEKVLEKVSEQSGYDVFFNADAINKAKPVSINVKDAPLAEVLKRCFANQPFTYTVEASTIVVKETKDLLIRTVSESRFLEVTGKVLDEKGVGLPGASVTLKGTKTVVTTTTEGSFSINAGANDVLIISSVGYQTREVPIDGKTVLTVTLTEASNDLETVVVMAYGSQRKTLVTGAVAQITGKDLVDRPVTRLTQALQGQIANLNISINTNGGAPNATQGINIRGYTGLGALGSPLIVIDGVQGGDISTINPDDVESISVLKDAASAAIYGSSAPYGVILIKTKQGQRDGKPTITYNNNFSMNKPFNLPTMVNSLVFATIFNEASANAGSTPIYSEETLQQIKDYQAGKIADETMVDPGGKYYLSWASGYANNDWFKVYYKDHSYSQQHNVSVNGGSASSNYFVGAGFNDRSGMYNFGDDKYKRYNLRANLNADVAKWLTFSLRTSFSRELFNTPNLYPGQTGGGDQAYMSLIARKFPTVPLYQPDGHFTPGSGVALQADGGRDNRITDKGLLTGELNFKLAKGWTATANYTFDGTYYDQSNHLKTLYEYYADGTSSPYGGTSPNNFLRYNERTQHEAVNIYSQYQKQLDKHYFSIMGGFVSDYINFQSYGVNKNFLFSDNIPAISTSYADRAQGSDNVNKLASNGVFGRFNYNYEEKYLLELSARYDGTSRFLSDVRWKAYPGISAGWNVDKESFFEPAKKYVSNLKLRASYGKLGDQLFLANNYYPFYPSLSTGLGSWLFGGTQQPVVSLPGLVNTQLTWVTTASLNLGTDASFLNNKLNASFDWYIRKATDVRGPAAVLPAVLGTGAPQVNNSSVDTKGWELSLGWRDKIGTVNYGLKGVLSDYTSKVVKYPNPTGQLSTWYAGLQQGEIWGYETVGLFKSAEEINSSPSQSLIDSRAWTVGDVRYADLNGDGKIGPGLNTLADHGDRKVIGNSTPRYSYGLTLDANWNGFDAMVFVQGVAKRDAAISGNYFWGIVNDEWQSSLFTTHLDRWTPDTPDGYYPKMYMSDQSYKNMQTQTRYLQNAAYMRIKNVQVGYTLTKDVLNRISLNKVRFYISLEDLATFTKFTKALDPELTMNDGKVYPLQKSFSAGLSVTF
jgi:TonB-linked SusC/RagA family outer membrane protein